MGRRENAARRAPWESYWSNCWKGWKNEIRHRERIPDSSCISRFQNPHPRRVQEYPYCEGGNRELDFGKSARESVWKFEDCGVEDEGEVLKCVYGVVLHWMVFRDLIEGKSMD